MWDFDGATDQRWEITHEREGYYSIVSVASGKAITAPSAEDASLTQTTLNKTYGIVSNDAQLWMITEVSEGVYKLSPKSDSSYFMAAGDGIFTSDGRNVEKRTDQSDGKDEWMIEKMYTYIVNNYYDFAFLIRNSSSIDILLDCQEIVIGKFLEIYHVNVVMNNYYYTSNGDLCKIDLYGSVTSSNIESACTHSSSCLTSSSYRTKLIEDKGNGSNTVTSVIWTGHRFDDNIGDRSNSSTYGNSVIITPWITSPWDDDSQSYSEVDYATKVVENSFELMHELSHQLSAPDHYCYKDEEDDSIKCGNDYCDECIYGYDEPRHCIMSYRFDISSLSTENTYCDDCKNMIQDHLIDHH